MDIKMAIRLADKMLKEFKTSEFLKLRVATHRIKGISSDISRMKINDNELDSYRELVKHIPPLAQAVIERCAELLPHNDDVPDALPSREDSQALDDLDNAILRFESRLGTSDLEDPKTLRFLADEFTEIINDAAETENIWGIQHTLKEIFPIIHALIHQCVEHAMPYAKDSKPTAEDDNQHRLFSKPSQSKESTPVQEKKPETPKGSA